MDNDTRRLTIRPTDNDLACLAIIGAALRAGGQPFPNKTDSIRAALKALASASLAPGASIQQ